MSESYLSTGLDKVTEVNNSHKSYTTKCRFCGSSLEIVFVDLGMSPLCESYLSVDELDKMEPFYPLKVWVCSRCLLVQLCEYVCPQEIFSEYAYFSSYSESWVQHAKDYTEQMVQRFGIDPQWNVLEIASNDGYLLQHFQNYHIPVLGVEPAANVASAALAKGIPTIIQFFLQNTAKRIVEDNGKADLLIANNVVAQVPDLNSFVEGMRYVLNTDGIITIEFPHLFRLMEGNQFDTIYHEHFSYFSFYTISEIFKKHGLRIFDVEELCTHGGSLRIYVCHEQNKLYETTPAVPQLRNLESTVGMNHIEYYLSFDQHVHKLKYKLIESLISLKKLKKSIVGYGAPGKGNTLLNYCGIRYDILDYVVDRNVYKHGKFTPGTHIPIYPPDKIKETKPDYLFILPWNIKTEIIKQMSFVREWGAKFLIPIPTPKIIN